MGDDHADLREFLSILTALQNLPSSAERSRERIEERKREKDVARPASAATGCAPPAKSPRISRRPSEHFNGTAGDAASFDPLHELLEHQAYRLAFWRTALDEINYRRFFDVNDLAALRMEEPGVFPDTHGLLTRLIAGGAVTGVRVDHPDGLFDPAHYFANLQRVAAGPDVEDGTPVPLVAQSEDLPLYVLAEKILSPGESLPDWAIHGTTGYDFLNLVNTLFVDRTVSDGSAGSTVASPGGRPRSRKRSSTASVSSCRRRWRASWTCWRIRCTTSLTRIDERGTSRSAR